MSRLRGEKIMHGLPLQTAIFEAVHTLPEGCAARQITDIPSDMLACRAHAEILAVKCVVRLQVFQHQIPRLDYQRRRQMRAGAQEVVDPAENPWPPLRRATY